MHADTTGPSPAAVWTMVGLVTLIQSTMSFTGLSVPPLSPFIKDSMGLTSGQVGLFMSALFLGAACSTLALSILAQRIGVKSVLGLVALVAALSALGASMAPSYLWVLVALFVCGFAYGGVTPATNEGVMQWSPPELRGTTMGLKQMGVTLGGSAAAAVMPLIASAGGWRQGFATLTITMAAAGAAAMLFYRRPDAAMNGDNRRSGRDREKEAAGIVATIGALVGDRSMRLATGLALLLVFVQMTLGTYLMLYLIGDPGYSEITAGVLLSCLLAGGIAGRFGWGWLSDLFFGGRRGVVLSLAALVSAAFSVLLVFITADWSLVVAAACIFLLGIGSTGWNGLYMNVVSEVNASQAALGTGLSLTVTYLGPIVGTPLFGLFIDAGVTYRTGWIGIAVFSLAAAGLAPRLDDT